MVGDRNSRMVHAASRSILPGVPVSLIPLQENCPRVPSQGETQQLFLYYLSTIDKCSPLLRHQANASPKGCLSVGWKQK